MENTQPHGSHQHRPKICIAGTSIPSSTAPGNAGDVAENTVTFSQSNFEAVALLSLALVLNPCVQISTPIVALAPFCILSFPPFFMYTLIFCFDICRVL